MKPRIANMGHWRRPGSASSFLTHAEIPSMGIPVVNRNHTMVAGDTSASATFVATKVAPQMLTVARASKIAAARLGSGRFFMSCAERLDRRRTLAIIVVVYNGKPE